MGDGGQGLTLIELLVSIAVLGVLAGVAMPLVQVTVTRTRELEMRRALRKVREGLDQFKAEYDKARTNARDARADVKKRVSVDRTGYPLTLDELVEAKILRRIPRDPMTAEGKWVTRSYSDNPDSSLSDGKDVYDIRSASKAVALDGTTYDTW
ncbi:MAG: prepilin-type N-terminal cleavage/methylation domain-containing protein [candidate division NC10 bacterium]|nr:prepilin-type N-terminal cleavage/methylation domain-containing protein [candidate division NC10 bacterium]